MANDKRGPNVGRGGAPGSPPGVPPTVDAAGQARQQVYDVLSQAAGGAQGEEALLLHHESALYDLIESDDTSEQTMAFHGLSRLLESKTTGSQANPRLRFYFARSCLNFGQADKARQQYQMALLHPDCDVFLTEHIMDDLSRPAGEGGMGMNQETIVQFLFDLIDDHRSDIKTERAISLCNRLVDLAPAMPDAWCYLGVYYEEAGNKEDAGKAYQNALDLDPSDEEAKRALARVRGAPSAPPAEMPIAPPPPPPPLVVRGARQAAPASPPPSAPGVGSGPEIAGKFPRIQCIVTTPDGTTQAFEFRQKFINIGSRERDNEASIVIKGDENVKSYHAYISTNSDGDAILYDWEGTFLNGQPVRKARLKNGDIIQVGNTTITINSAEIKGSNEAPVFHRPVHLTLETPDENVIGRTFLKKAIHFSQHSESDNLLRITNSSADTLTYPMIGVDEDGSVYIYDPTSGNAEVAVNERGIERGKRVPLNDGDVILIDNNRITVTLPPFDPSVPPLMT